MGTLLMAALVVPLLFRRDLRSIERGNRFYRAGDPTAAADVYRSSPSKGTRVLYNLGTALLVWAPDSAQAFLGTASEAEDRPTAQRAFYNLGYSLLQAAQERTERDSMVAVLGRAVESNRAALRLDPADQSARWNLALAQRRLDALVPPGEDSGRESAGNSDDEMPMNEADLARSESAEAESGPEPEDPRAADSTGERRGPRQGAQEAWATQDPGPLTRNDAAALLARVHDQPEAMVRGLLWSHRPDVAWWTSQPYPGGSW